MKIIKYFLVICLVSLTYLASSYAQTTVFNDAEKVDEPINVKKVHNNNQPTTNFASDAKTTQDLHLTIINHGGFLANYYVSYVAPDGKVKIEFYEHALILQAKTFVIPKGSSFVHLDVTYYSQLGDVLLLRTYITNEIIATTGMGDLGSLKFILLGTMFDPEWSTID